MHLYELKYLKINRIKIAAPEIVLLYDTGYGQLLLLLLFLLFFFFVMKLTQKEVASKRYNLCSPRWTLYRKKKTFQQGLGRR